MEPGTPEAFALRWGNDRQTQARMLREAVNPNGARVTVGSMLDAANRNAQTQNNAGCRNRATGSGGALRGVPFAVLYCLNSKDTTDDDRTPQGINGTEDAQPGTGTVDRHKAIVFSWHEGRPGSSGTGTRLSFLDTATNRYIHVLLVEPNDDGTDYGEVSVHAGGIVWYQNYIFVADNQRGIHVYDTTNLLQLARNPKGTTSPTCPTGRQPGAQRQVLRARVRLPAARDRPLEQPELLHHPLRFDVAGAQPRRPQRRPGVHHQRVPDVARRPGGPLEQHRRDQLP
ncbi:hypothetical protein SHL15_1172 [Streptomyces hygroscopicus subsp. limoneus]|nr:hypothetical protein SHL15_1172 [Streptomyces hygroscopicus subsp. limoneus]